MAEMKSVYSAVRTGSLNKTVCASSFRTNSDLCHLKHKMIGFYSRDEKCLQRGTAWVFKYSGLSLVLKGLNNWSFNGKALICREKWNELFKVRYRYFKFQRAGTPLHPVLSSADTASKNISTELCCRGLRNCIWCSSYSYRRRILPNI